MPPLPVRLPLPAWDALARFQLWDHSALGDVSDFSAAVVRATAEVDRKGAATVSHVAIALVCPDDLLYGLGRMYTALTENEAVSTSVFRHAADAELWLREHIARRSLS